MSEDRKEYFKKYNREYYSKHKEEILKKQKQYQTKNKEKVSERHRKYNQKIKAGNIILNELEEWTKSEYERYYNDKENLVFSNVETIDFGRMLDKIQELKEKYK